MGEEFEMDQSQSGQSEGRISGGPRLGVRILRWLSCVAIVPVLIVHAQAQKTWVGGVGSFYEGTNWSGGTVPESFDSIVIDNGGTVQSSDAVDVSEVSIGGGSTYAVLSGSNSYFTPDAVYLGTGGSGTLTVGSQALAAPASDLYLGYVSNATGVVSMDGGYLSPFTTYVGYQGIGTMTLENGSTLQSTVGYVGYLAGSTGLVQLSDSTWKAEDEGLPVDITVGFQGEGEIQATNSEISALTLTLGSQAGSSGTVTMNGGTMTIQEAITVGNSATGTLALTNGAVVSSDGLTVAALAGSTGSLSVYGSTLTNASDLYVGLNGNGTLTASNSQIDATTLFVARNLGVTASATVSGGVMNLTDDLHVGSGGSGTFTLDSGGILHTDIANVAFEAGSTGELNVLGGVWTNTRAIFVGVSGDGTLNLGDGGTIESESGYIAQDPGGTGAVNISGGASWTMTNTLVVGVKGHGQFAVSGGGQVSSVWSQVGLDPGSGGSVTLSNGSWTTTETLTIGVEADGSFTAVAGSDVTAGAIEIAASDFVTGSFRMTNSTLSTVNLIAGSGTATAELSGVQMKLLGGSEVIDTLLIDGFSPGNVVVGGGGLTVDTQGGNAQIASELTGTGSLTKTGAGRLRLTTANTYGGGTFVEGGVLELTGNSNLGAGDIALGTGELRAHTNSTLAGDLDGGIQLISVAAGQTGTFSAADGQTLTLVPLDFLLVAGSTMQVGSAGNTGNVVFAPTGAAALTADSAINVAAGTLTAGNNELGFMTSIAASTTVASGATLDFADHLSTGGINALFGAGTVNTGTNTATVLTVNSGDFAGDIAGGGALVKESSGTLTLSGQSAFTGGTTVNAGTLLVDGDLSFGLGEVTVNTGGTLGGSGIVGTITLNGGALAPGSSPGTFTAQNLFWQDGLLVFDLGPSSDFLNLTGDLNGFGTSYGFSFIDAGWVEGSTYDLINFFDTTITIDDFFYTNGGGFAGEFAYEGNTLQFTVNTVPEPSTMALVACAAVIGWFVRARRHRRGPALSAPPADAG